ncbi:MAG: 16S rRNA processing protein RimM [Candidatus Marinimicrobia bacterium]|nr:16S rRNA processing protein RimM [Candidatus Neomarinimicrobiota bacterium]
MNSIENLIPIGKVLKAHGLKGELKISLFDISSKILLEGINLWFYKNNSYQNYKLEKLRGSSKNIIVKLSEINDRNNVVAFLNKKIFLSKNDYPEPDENNYHLSDLINLEIFDENNNSYGFVCDAIKLPGNNVLIFKYENKEIMVPIVDYFIELFDFKKKVIKVKNINSLLEI